MVRTQIQLTEEQVKGLKKIAASRHLSVAELIRRSVDAILKTNAVVDSEERYKRAMETAGRFRSGKSDISGKHDKYLGEALGK
ncbi:MAG: ribbon-helix-helix protein, CopG family [Nitrospirae bacterium]|nr:ribbon-helix-helix protein, CopG family [Nitrospirota bacterium]